MDQLLTAMDAFDQMNRLAWARMVKVDIEHHSDARIRRACRIFLTHTGEVDQAEREWATEILKIIPTGAKI